MRIAYVTETWWPSTDGVVTRLTATVRQLRRWGHDLLIIAPAGGAPEFEGIPVRSVPNVRVSFIYGGKPWGLPVPRVGRYLDAFRPDVVHAVNPFVVGIAGVLHASRRGWPLVASYHTNIAQYADFYHLGFTKPAIWAILRALHNRAQVNLTPSQAVKADIEAHGIRRVRVWQRGVDVDLFHPRRADPVWRRRVARRPDRPLVLYVGRLAAEKHIERLRALFEEGLDVNLVLVGEGPDREHLEWVFRGLPVAFTGVLHGLDLARAYASADVFVFPSTTETLGLVVLEAMASGLPVAVAETGPAHELLDGSGAGFLFDAGNGAALARAVRTLLDPVRRREMGQAARREAEARGWAEPTRQLVEVYEEVRRLGAAPAARGAVVGP
ncbi:GDP-mannose-dependent alpha-mannosyltransferase [Candidatus Hydrogenisulfobacillus filiaventi]|uniref:GDP-mannose-dependent alpha-mannosyltransferase n=1 Tax=Candidatus Hydrogenisulfobacillus filiaventi TaxID=2707344 RepID=A0A6F8ZJH1_9FIRM|nr:glycosyltransferase family 1 protein [Bacillota bacterium]CAB1129885.1 GDP-mannose-dependent alpha-mannosyltransferase [Candidatus Hydrogenisulfobacillus filiaventi]